MKIFISAYACEPNKGSEPGIGWNFVLEMSKYHEVHVLTRKNNKKSIEKALKEIERKNLIFHYYDLPKILMFWKKGRRGYKIYYYLWQIFSFLKYRKYIIVKKFDIVHHLTFGANWMPSLFMTIKSSKTIWGPVGSEDLYKPIFKSLPINLRLKESLRNITKLFFYYIEPARWITILSADLILEHSSKYAKYRYPKFLNKKIKKSIQTGLNIKEPIYTWIKIMKRKKNNEKIRLIIASELVSWKGVILASEIFSLIAQKYNNIELIVIGEGPEKNRMKKIFKKYKVQYKVRFKGFVSREQLMKELYEADILLYPAYHHGLATLILQSMYAYLPIISIEGDIISEVVDKKCGLVARGKNIKEIKNNLIKNTEILINDKNLRNKLALQGRKLVEKKYSWESLVKDMNIIYNDLMKGKHEY